MGTFKILGLVAGLCLCIHNTVGEWQNWICEAGGKPTVITPFSRVSRTRLLLNIPCRYKMAHVKCTGDKTEVFAESSMDFAWENDLFVSGVTVRTRTKNDNGCKTYQTLTLTSEKFGQYLSRRNYTVSPWEWSSSGCQVDAAKKNLGYFKASERRAKVTVGKLTISYAYVTNTTHRTNHRYTLEIRCVGHKFTSFENYPDVMCGNENTTQEDLDKVMRQVPGDSLLHTPSSRNTYAMLVKQKDVQQTDPRCLEVQSFVQGECRNFGDHNHACEPLMNSWGFAGSRRGYCDGEGDIRFDVYMECMRIKCGRSRVCSSQSAESRCDLLQRAAKQCEHSRAGNLVNDLLVQANCPRHDWHAVGRYNLYYWVPAKMKSCTVTDRVSKSWYRDHYTDTSTFFTRYGIRVTIPCSYRMAYLNCGGAETEILADHALDKRGLVYVEGVTVKTTLYYNYTYNGRTYRTRGYYISFLRNIHLKRYIRNELYTNNTDPWKVTWRGGNLTGDDAVVGSFDQSSKSALLRHRDLTVTFRYTDLREEARPNHPGLDITCNDPNFSAKQSFPLTLCGNPTGYNTDVEDLVDKIPASPQHKSYNNDIVILAAQGSRGGGKLCYEAAQILQKGCLNMGDVLMECHLIYRMDSEDFTYGKCALKKTDVDPFKLYVTCLRVLCDSQGYKSSEQETCDTLQQVHDACKNQVKHPHMHIAQLLQRADCPQNGTSSTAP